MSHKSSICVILYIPIFDMEEQKNKKTLRGTVVSAKMQDTVVVAVDRYVKHPLYGKYRRKTKRYKVHCPGNTVAVGEQVTIESCRPVSKEKYFQILPQSV